MTAPADVTTCYRHPDRIAGISCQRCGRPICPSCMQQASVGFHCPECVRAGGQRTDLGRRAIVSRPIVTQTLIAINVVAYVAMIGTRALDPWSDWGQAFATRFGDVQGLYADGLLFGPAVSSEPWRIATSGFLHANDLPFGLIHIGFNMFALWSIGRLLEPMLGRAGFLALYVAALFGGSLGVVLLSPTAFTVGASGAVFGVLGGLVVVAWARGVDVLRSGLGTTLGIWLAWTFLVPNISIGGHLGGLLAGAAAGALLELAPRRLGPAGPRLALGATWVLAAALALASWTLMVGRYPVP